MQYVKQMLDYVWQPLIESMVKVCDLTSCVSLYMMTCCQSCFFLMFYIQGLYLSDVPPSRAAAIWGCTARGCFWYPPDNL